MTTIAQPNLRNHNSKNSNTSHHPLHLPLLQPSPASLLLSQDPRLSRPLHDGRNGGFSTGCRELDSQILLNGGFERSSVVGLSCEEEETIGLAVVLQVVARMLLLGSSMSEDGKSGFGMGSKQGSGIGIGNGNGKVMIITTLATTTLLPRLRLALVSEAKVLSGQTQVDKGMIKRCLERVLVARVFDAEGLGEVLRELEEKGAGGSEGRGDETRNDNDEGSLPDLILITNTSHLLATLFNRNKTGYGGDKWSTTAAHNSAAQLSDKIRALSRRGPSVMLLNSTTSPATAPSSSNFPPRFDDNNNRGSKQPDLSIMRSIFNPPPPPPALNMEVVAPGYDMAGLVGTAATTGHVAATSHRVGGQGGYGNHIHSQTQAQTAAAAAVAASRRNKPSYGMVFSQMLDLHLLCTKVPRGRSRQGGGYGGYVWAVEVLLDELGVYEGLEGLLDREGGGKGKGLTRRSREQRWGAVDIEEGSGRVVDTFR